jgi:hypothetical protein
MAGCWPTDRGGANVVAGHGVAPCSVARGQRRAVKVSNSRQQEKISY